ncbi:hypothetical protein [Microlunatus speluncae]|uniref:hypothetical protein n=1 Tax=Microlunatus speluncae TaxID=2594267 RepID=UPI0012661A65|nr:hypothetical protein [Microlunatus speluncae]
MITVNRRLRRAAALVIMTVLMITGGGSATATAATEPARAEYYTCFVKTVGVPFYNKPYPSGGEIKGWVTQGQGFDVFAEDFGGHWRGGNLWGGPSGVWIHANYLAC